MKTLQDYLDFPCPLSPEWKECILSFLSHLYHDYSQSLETVDTYRTFLKQFLSSGRNPNMITTHDIRTFVRSPSKPHHGNPRGEPSASLQNARVTAIRSLFDFAATHVPQGWSHPLFEGKNPTAGLNMRSVARNPKGLSESEIEAFFSAIPDTPIGARDKALFIVYFLTSRRRSEIARLRYGDIQPAVFVEGTKRRSGWRYGYVGKGDGSQIRYRELHPLAKASIDEYLVKSGRIATINSDDFLFTSFQMSKNREHVATDRPIPGCNIAARMKLYLALANIDPRLHSIHSWRHSGVQHRYQLGEGLLELNSLLDHVSLNTTKIYLDRLVGEADEGAQLLVNKFGHLLGK